MYCLVSFVWAATVNTHVGKDVLRNQLGLDFAHDLHLELKESAIVLSRQLASCLVKIRPTTAMDGS
jgi:hypothetical protein